MNFLILTFLLLFLKTTHGDKTVRTDSGPIRGRTLSSGKIGAFLGVPFAEPPVGSLRFAKPVPKAPWKDVYDATELPPPCIQMNFGKERRPDSPDITDMTEDCLYLNMWVPQGKKVKPKPVIVFIHGGAFTFGSGSMAVYDGARLAEYGDVIVATINYRLGALGFFAGLIDESPGSMGMHDQVMAIEWIKNNAKHFNGDPDNIILMGESSGAIAVTMHQISPLSKTLFNRAVVQSASAFHPMFSIDNKRLSELSQMYAEVIGCTSDGVTVDSNPKDIVDCMKKIPAEKFSEIDTELFKKAMYFFPRTGDDFLPENTIDSFRKGHFKNIDVLMGFTRDEGPFMMTTLRSDLFHKFGQGDVNGVFNETSAREAIKLYIGSGDEAEDNKIVQDYLDRVDDGSGYTYLKTIADVYGDFVINCGLIFQSEFQSLRGAPVYFYMFDYRPDSTVFAEWMGVTHFEEVQYVFGNPLYKDFTEQEKELSRDMMDMWVSFAKTGNPNIPGGVLWPRYTYNDPKYYIIGKRDRLGPRPDNNRCELWRNRFRSIIDGDFIQTLNAH